MKTLKTNNSIEGLDVAFVEGAISSVSQAAEVRKVRENTEHVVAIGACTGKPSTSRNRIVGEQMDERIRWYMDHFDYARDVVPLDEVVRVDDRVRGCPMNASAFFRRGRSTWNSTRSPKVARRNIAIEAIPKIEGNAGLEVLVEDGAVKDLRFKITDYRRFLTVAARGKRMNAVPSFLSRICGTCSVAHLFASLMAIENLQVVHISLPGNPHDVDLAEPADLLQVPQLEGKVEVVHSPAREQGEMLDLAVRDQGDPLKARDRVQYYDALLVHEGQVLVRFDCNEPDARHRTTQPPGDLQRPPVLRHLQVAEDVDLHGAATGPTACRP